MHFSLASYVIQIMYPPSRPFKTLDLILCKFYPQK